MHGFNLEPGTLLVVISVLVYRLEEVGSRFSDFEDRKTIKRGKMFKVVMESSLPPSASMAKCSRRCFSVNKSTERRGFGRFVARWCLGN